MAKVGILGGITAMQAPLRPYDIIGPYNGGYGGLLFYKDMSGQDKLNQAAAFYAYAIRLYTVPNDVKMAVVNVKGMVFSRCELTVCTNSDGKTAEEVFRSLMVTNTIYESQLTSGDVKCMVLGAGDSIYLKCTSIILKGPSVPEPKYDTTGFSCVVTGIEHV